MALKQATCVPTGYPAWARRAQIGDYGGDLDKEGSELEGTTPYAGGWYRELQAMRGSGFAQKLGTLVHAENLALARFFSATCSRIPEKVRANSVPGRSDEKLDYWVEFLNIPTAPDDQKWQKRQRCAAHYRSSKGNIFTEVEAAVSDLLGEAFIELQLITGTDLATPPTQTFWPTVNPGPPAYDLGGGAWLSERCRLVVVVQQPSGVTLDEFLNLMDIQLYTLLDRMLPVWASWEWVVENDGFLLDLSSLDLEGLTPS